MKHFDQYCPIAHALSQVGERWSLLVVRELLNGPKRYTDLAHGLPGIGTNILASRLRDLEEVGVIQKRKLPPPTPVTVYELTEYGKGLNEALYALARWGARTLGPPKAGDDLAPDWGINALPALFNPAAARGLTMTYELRVDDDAFTARITDGTLEAAVGAADHADLIVETDMPTFYGLATGELEPTEALQSGCARVEGDVSELDRFFRVFSVAPRVSVAA
jgi:DNA-binding HxlR family transcriptional regulator/putative sterol carrier protein